MPLDGGRGETTAGRQSAEQRLKLLLLPHVPIRGGAGIYNAAAIAALGQLADVTLLGPDAESYRSRGGMGGGGFPAMPARPILPAYAGASWRAWLYYAALAPRRAWTLSRWARRHRGQFEQFDGIVATSSIDLLTLRAITRAVPRLRSVCLIQENAFLQGARGGIQLRLLREVGRLIAITPSWAERAARAGLAAMVVMNPFSASAAADAKDDPQNATDLLFMGGGSKLKGTELFLDLIERLSARRAIRAALLGDLAGAWQTRASEAQARLAARGSSLVIAGFVADPQSYLRQTRLLLLPIAQPHFCRPAVEAGLCGRTFVISRLPELHDFAEDNRNCRMATSGDVADWQRVCEALIDDEGMRHRLAAENERLCRSRFSAEAFTQGFQRLVAEWR